jgi:hypothetical protein
VYIFHPHGFSSNKLFDDIINHRSQFQHTYRGAVLAALFISSSTQKKFGA